MKLIFIILFTLLTQPIVANAEDIYWPGVGYISEEDLPDDGTGTSGSAVLEKSEQTDNQVTGPIIISLEDIEETSQAQEPVVVITPDPVIQEVIQEDAAPETEITQDVIQEDISEEIVLQESESEAVTTSYWGSSETDCTNDSYWEDSGNSYWESPSPSPSESPSPSAAASDTQEESSNEFNLVLILCIGFVAGCLVAFALFRAMR